MDQAESAKGKSLKFKTGEELKHQRGSRFRTVTFLKHLNKGIATVVNENGFMEAVFEIELERKEAA